MTSHPEPAAEAPEVARIARERHTIIEEIAMYCDEAEDEGRTTVEISDVRHALHKDPEFGKAELFPLLTINQAAEKLQVSRDYIYNRIHSGEITATDLGTDQRPKLRIRPDVLARFIDQRRG